MKLKLPVYSFPREFDPSLLEMMDRPHSDQKILEEDLQNLQTINHWLGGYRLIRREMNLFFEHANPSPSCTLLDFCTGSADIPRVIINWARAHGKSIQITATDFNPFMVDLARKQSRDYPEIKVESANLLAPSYSDASFDLVICNLALHHFSTIDAVAALKHMWRIAKMGILINDLNRNRVMSLCAKYFIPLMSANSMTQYDAYLSTRRAFTSAELRRIAFHARIPLPETRTYFLGRQVLAAFK
jgi:ubiquinone/menaquinone biosynthesis C-methylase UbiE